MPLQKILFKPGVNRENTRYTTEGGWYDCDKVRFRQGTPEKIGGWERISTSTFLGICRSIWNWVTLASINLLGIGTNLKFYLEQGGNYNDITPIRATATLSNPFTATTGSAVITVADVAHGCNTGDYVTFFSATSLGGNITAAVLNQEYVVTVVNLDSYTFTATATANGSDTGHGGTTYASYQIHVGPATVQPLTGWGAGLYGYGTWGNGLPDGLPLRLWSQYNFGENLVFGPRGGGIYYWQAQQGVSGISASITVGTPAVCTLGAPLLDDTPVQLSTTGTLPTGLIPGTTYYVVNASGVTCNLSDTPGGTEIDTTGTQSGVHEVMSRGIDIADLSGASETPIVQNFLLVSDASRFTFAFGANPIFETAQDPMLIRWSDQESLTVWYPEATNQAGFVRLSHGSETVRLSRLCAPVCRRATQAQRRIPAAPR